jgi:hypothetical protein
MAQAAQMQLWRKALRLLNEGIIFLPHPQCYLSVCFEMGWLSTQAQASEEGKRWFEAFQAHTARMKKKRVKLIEHWKVCWKGREGGRSVGGVSCVNGNREDWKRDEEEGYGVKKLHNTDTWLYSLYLLFIPPRSFTIMLPCSQSRSLSLSGV